MSQFQEQLLLNLEAGLFCLLGLVLLKSIITEILLFREKELQKANETVQKAYSNWQMSNSNYRSPTIIFSSGGRIRSNSKRVTQKCNVPFEEIKNGKRKKIAS